MATENSQVLLDQPLSDALAALTKIAVAVKAGKSVAEIAAAELVDAVKLIGEIPQIPADVKSFPQASLNSAALGVSELAGALLGLS